MTTLPLWAIVDTDGNVENLVESELSPLVICHPTCTAVLNTIRANIGWTYKDGVFTNPNPVIQNQTPASTPAPTLESIQAQTVALQAQFSVQMAALQAQLAALIATPTPAAAP